MNDDKGKGRVVDSEDSDKSPTADLQLRSSSSIVERVTASVTGLVQNALSAPTRGELSDARSSGLISTGKDHQNGGSRGLWAESSRANNQTDIQTSRRRALPSFKGGHKEEQVRAAESNFSSFLDGIDPFTPSPELFHGADHPEWRTLDTTPEYANARADNGLDKVEQVRYHNVYEQEQHDGDEVFSILSRPPAIADELEALPMEDEDFNWDLTDEQIWRLRALVNESFLEPHRHKPVPIDHQLNLVPSMVSAPSTFRPIPFMDTKRGESCMYFGDIPQDRARQIWMEQWEGVLTRYSDEVWGNLLPLVVQAREEVKAIKEEHSGATIEQSKALRRLRLLLDHVRK